jgi:hypothetical protein
MGSVIGARRSSSTLSSRLLVMRLTVDRPTFAPISASVTLAIFRVEMPFTYEAMIAAQVAAVPVVLPTHPGPPGSAHHSPPPPRASPGLRGWPRGRGSGGQTERRHHKAGQNWSERGARHLARLRAASRSAGPERFYSAIRSGHSPDPQSHPAHPETPQGGSPEAVHASRPMR